MGRRRDAARASGDHRLLRVAPPRRRHVRRPRMRHLVGSLRHRRCRLQDRLEQRRHNDSASQYSRCVATCAASVSARPSSNVRRLRKFCLLGGLSCDVGMMGLLLFPAPRKRGGGTARRAVGGASDSTALLRRKQIVDSDAPSTAQTRGPPPPLLRGG